jgi:hypothetical protein
MIDDNNEPVHLAEDAETGDRFLVYGTDKGLRLDIRYEGDTLWMTQAQIGQLFGRDVSTISRHIANVFEEGELNESTSLQKVQTTTGRPATLYNLDMVISVGYRVSSAQATVFRRWATSVLVQFAKKGFVVDAPRLKLSEKRLIPLIPVLQYIDEVTASHRDKGRVVAPHWDRSRCDRPYRSG